MREGQRRTHATLVALIDAAMVLAAMVLAWWLRWGPFRPLLPRQEELGRGRRLGQLAVVSDRAIGRSGERASGRAGERVSG